MSDSTLPIPSNPRWQLLRGGLANLYRFDAEEFWFERGRLLLRGNNGTGKSRVLALQLPFLLDGDVSPDRLEPDANQARRVEWNLLLDTHEERLGYTWTEFGRQDEQGRNHFVTLGCGLRAVAGRGLVGRWFFITRQRVGKDLCLKTQSGHMLSQDRLTAAIGSSGQVFSTAKDYRHGVDTALFGLGPDRYAALVDLLVQLRHPQLSRKFDEAKMSAALSGALPPVSGEVIAVVADSFRSLETDRNDLETFVQAGRAVDTFLAEYRRYASIASRRAAQDLKSASSAHDLQARKLRAAEESHAAAASVFTDATSRLVALEEQAQRAVARVRTLGASPQMKDAEALQAASDLAEEHGKAHVRASEHHEQMTSARQSAADQHAAVERDATSIFARVRDAGDRARESSRPASLHAEHTTAAELLDLPTLTEDSAMETAESLLDEAVERMRRAAKRLRTLNGQVDHSRRTLLDAEKEMIAATVQLDEAAGAESIATATCERELGALLDAYRDWHAGLEELHPAPVDMLREDLLSWSEMPEGRSPIQEAVGRASADAAQQLAAGAATTRHQRGLLHDEHDRLDKERSALIAGRQAVPPAPHTRSGEARHTRTGAPLWQLCDFGSDVASEDRARIESALEAAGLLDAWIEPQGARGDALLADTTLTISNADAPAPEGCRLSDLLVPVIDPPQEAVHGVDAEVVAAILDRIGVGQDAGSVWITTSGGFRLGPLQGAWTKPQPEYIGHAARESARRTRVQTLSAQIDGLVSQMAVLDERLIALDAREAVRLRETAAAPDEERVRRAQVALADIRERLVVHRRRLQESERSVLAARRTLDTAVSQRDTEAHDLGLAQWTADVNAYEDALSDYREALARLWPTVRAHTAAQRQLNASAQRLSNAQAMMVTARQVAEDCARRARAATVHFKTLRESRGAAVAEILGQYEHARKEEERLHTEIGAAVEKKVEAARRESQTRTDLDNLGRDLELAIEARKAAAERFRSFASARLLSLVMPALTLSDVREWSLSRSIDVAREIDSALESADPSDAAWERVQKEIHKPFQELTDALHPYGYQPSAEINNGVLVVGAVFQGTACTMDELRSALSEEISRRQTLLDAREREVLENHLIGEVAHHLHERLHAGQHFVDRMNEEVRARPMSTGMMLRFTWAPSEDGSTDLRDIRAKLLSDPAAWAPADRRAVGEFLSREIREARAQSEGGTWDDHLRDALDYRRWHVFGIDRHQDGHWKRLTKRSYGTGSGGEKAVLLTVPLFVAAAAHYQSAREFAPRLILLDEAFVGIDSDMRAKCMGLLNVFDLDFIMTSEREWACYSTLPGVAICQLSARPGIDAVHVSRWVWNGKELLPDVRVLPSAASTALREPGANGELAEHP